MARRAKAPSLWDIFKPGILLFVFISSSIGYGFGFRIEQDLSFVHFLLVQISLLIFTAGSFCLNQAQEAKIDSKMPRTQNRPIPKGLITQKLAFTLAIYLLVFGGISLFILSELAFYLSVLTAIFYNGFYTVIWKRTMAFGAVPGALPGAMPVLIGYGAINENIFTMEALYLFLVMFIWQMPHFWSLAIRFKNDYKAGGIPVLPGVLGVEKTLVHMGMYLIAYVVLALASPWFVDAGTLYLFVVVPFAFKVAYEFYIYYKSNASQNWLPFFLWTNLSMLVFLSVPLFEKWAPYIFGVYYG